MKEKESDLGSKFNLEKDKGNLIIDVECSDTIANKNI
jgi:hypothetical protein